MLTYLDDIIGFSGTEDKHIQQLHRVLEVHKEYGMKLKLSKCKVLHAEIEHLGHLVSKEGVRMIPCYVQKILDWPVRTTGKQLKQFLEFIGCYLLDTWRVDSRPPSGGMESPPVYRMVGLFICSPCYSPVWPPIGLLYSCFRVVVN